MTTIDRSIISQAHAVFNNMGIWAKEPLFSEYKNVDLLVAGLAVAGASFYFKSHALAATAQKEIEKGAISRLTPEQILEIEENAGSGKLISKVCLISALAIAACNCY